jgi:hypothetical protein
MELDLEKLGEFREALKRLIDDPDVFRAAAEAVAGRDAEKFHGILAELELLPVCVWLCRWFCTKQVGFICRRLCPEGEDKEPTIDEMSGFARATIELLEDRRAFSSLLDAYERQDREAWSRILDEKELYPFCRQFCRWFAFIYCRRVCKEFCPKTPEIKSIGFIPVNQIDAEGYADGPSVPPGLTPVPDAGSGVGDHPFGGLVNVRGNFNIPNPLKYRVEYSDNLTTWTAIKAKTKNKPPFSAGSCVGPHGPDPQGWYDIPGMCDPQYLTDWNTRASGAYAGKWYLRLTVRNSAGDFMSDLVTVRIDNVSPEADLQPPVMRAEDGSEKEIKCGGITKGEGKIVIRFKATDENFGRLTLQAWGGCGLYVDIADETTGLVNRSYDGDVTDTGEPPWREVVWDPWKEAVIHNNPCCYLIRLRVWDRTIVNNHFHAGRFNADHEAVMISLPPP